MLTFKRWQLAIIVALSAGFIAALYTVAGVRPRATGGRHADPRSGAACKRRTVERRRPRCLRTFATVPWVEPGSAAAVSGSLV